MMRDSHGVLPRRLLLRPADRMIWLLLAALLLIAAWPLQPASAQNGPSPTAVEWTYLLVEDFEDGQPPGSCRILGNPTWHPARANARHGAWSAYSAGGGLGSVQPPGPYPNDMRAWMIFGPFDLSQATAAELEFDYWLQLGPKQDRLFWGVSNGGNYYGESASGDTHGWRHATVDLSRAYGGFLGEPQVWIGFEFRSDERAAGEGAYVDYVTLRVKTGRPSLPARAYLPLVVGGP
jgi:hypothetical protein